jgi:tetratricopeptide (TPR) repeat protein
MRDATWESFKLDADDQGLAVLSRLCFELSEPFPVEDSNVCEAAIAHELVSRQVCPTDLFGERNEILSQLALMAWRRSRQFGSTETMLAWERKYRVAFAQPSAERDCLEQYLATKISDRSDQFIDEILADVKRMFGICELLRVYRDAYPAKAAAEASFFYERVMERQGSLLDGEKVYILGVLALLAGSAERFLGRRGSATKWLERARSSFSNLSNAEPDLARLAYAELTLWYEYRKFDQVLKAIPDLLRRFAKLEMKEDETKCLYVESLALKESGRPEEALAKFLFLERLLSESDPCGLLAGVHCKVGDIYSAKGWHDRAMREYQRALPLIGDSRRSCMSADFKGTVAETCRNIGQFAIAIDLFREAISEYDALSMNTLAAYLRIFLAETLLLAGQPHEAEIEILAAIPTIEKEKMVEEGLAALSLLRESVSRSQTDPSSLRALRELLKGVAQ